MASGGLSVRALSAPNMPPAPLRWIEMNIPQDGGTSNNPTTGVNAALQVLPATNDFIRTIKDPLNLISVIGPARSGKSTLMNLLSGSSSDLFPTSSGFITFTKGVSVTTKLFSLPQFSSLEGASPVNGTDPNSKVSFVDTEGQGAVGTLYDVNLFSPVLLCAKVVIYNRTGGLLAAEILSQLGMMTEAGKRLNRGQATAVNGSNGTANGTASPDRQFGHLVILFNRFQLNASTSVDTLRDALLNPENGNESAALERNQIRTLLASSFASISVFILPDNQIKPEVMDEMAENPARFLTMQDFRPKYLDYFAKLRAGLSEVLKTPHELVPNTPLTGGAMADFVPEFAAAINSQEPLNIPSIFEASRNQALNRAVAKFQRDLTINTDTYAAQHGSPTVQITRIMEKDIELLMADMLGTVSYMPDDVLKELRTKASLAAEPVVKAVLDANLLKLKVITTAQLNAVIAALPASVDLEFTDDKLSLLSPDQIKPGIEKLKTSIGASFESFCNGYDSRSVPANYRELLDTALNAEAERVKAKSEKYWKLWIADVSSKELDKLTATLSKLASDTKVGDDRAWNTGSLTGTTSAKRNFEAALRANYLGPDLDGQLKQFQTDVDVLSATQTATWSQNESDVKNQLRRTLLAAQTAYTTRLADSILDTSKQPAPLMSITPAATEKAVLETFISRNRVADDIASDALFAFDNHVSTTRASFSKEWNSAMDTFNRYFDDQLLLRKKEWSDEYARAMGAMDLNVSVEVVKATCEQIAAAASNRFAQFESLLGSLQTGTVAAMKLSNARNDLNTMNSDGTKGKLNQMDEQVALYNRALLNKTVKPIVDKTLAETQNFTNLGALDDALRNAKNEFVVKARLPVPKDGLSSQQRIQNAWNDWSKKAYDGLSDNVRRNGMSYGLNGKELMPEVLQRKIVENVRDAAANMANTLGFSWISSRCFTGSGVIDGTPGSPGENDEKKKQEAKDEKMRSFFLRNTLTPPDDGYWRDRKTNMAFRDWEIESSDYVLGKPIIEELKPQLMFVNDYPASPNPEKWTGSSSVTVTDTVTNSNANEFSWGAKTAIAGKWGDAKGSGEYTASLEGTFGGKITDTTTNAKGSSFTIAASMPIQLPPNVGVTVTQLGFEQKCTVPYTAKFKFIPKLRLTDGFVRAGGVFLKKDYFDANKSTNRVYKTFDFPRLDRLREEAERNADPWNWTDFRSNNQYYLDFFAETKHYEFYVRGRWEGVTGKRVITTVTPTARPFGLLPDDLN